jgi:hypothetical protein
VPGGIWQGKQPNSDVWVVGIITEAGESRFNQSDGSLYSCTVTTSGNAISCSYNGIAMSGFTYPDGSTYGTGTLQGTIKARQTIIGTTNFTTHDGLKMTGAVDMSFNDVYNTGSSLAKIAGNYLDKTNNAVLNVNSNGVLYEQDPASGCVINGQISIIDGKYNAYHVAFSFSSCTGDSAVLNGITATGLGFLDTKANPDALIIAVSNDAAHYGWYAGYPKT